MMRPIPVEEAAVEARVCPLMLAAMPKSLRTRAVSNAQTIGITTDYLMSLLLSYAYKGTATERAALLSAVTHGIGSFRRV